MNFGWNVETLFLSSSIVISTVILVLIIKTSWKQYGLLFLISSIVGQLLCLLFVETDLYKYPYLLFPAISPMPVFEILTFFPCYILIGVRYSPRQISYKIAFYMTMVHFGVFVEVVLHTYTKIIKYTKFWDTWDSYTWWWIYLLIFDWVGGMIVSEENKKPISEDFLKYGKLGWFITHFIFVGTIFLGGLLLGIRITE